MMRLINNELVWGERDLVKLAEIVGYEAATACHAPITPALLKIAKTSGVPMSKSARRQLRKYNDRVAHAKTLKGITTPAFPWSPNDRNNRGAFLHQLVALNFFWDMALPGYLNADKTGVGKTLVFLRWAYETVRAKNVLIVTKNIAKDQWADAIRTWVDSKQQITVISGTIAQQQALIKSAEGWVIGHWESLMHAGDAYRKRTWDVVGLDEGHMMNNRKAQRSKTVFKLRAARRMVMTAHPFNKNAGELFAILRFLYPHIYTSYWRFVHLHCKVTPRAFGGFDVEGSRRPKLLKWEIAPFTISRTKQEVWKSLPQVTYQRSVVDLTPRGRREYDRLRKEIFAEIDAMGGGTKTLPLINEMVSVTRARQYLVDPGLIGGAEKSLKYPVILDLLEEIAEPTVVFTGFAQAAIRLATFLKQKAKLSVRVLRGGMIKQVPDIKRRFAAGEYHALICVDKAADTALNLGGYGYVVHLDLPALPRDYEQAVGRVDRPQEGTGRLIPTTAYRVVTRGTYEERKEAQLTKRDDEFREVFTARQLRRLFE